MNRVRWLPGLVLLLVGIPSVHAGILDLRVGAGLSAANPSAFDQRVNNLSGTDLSAGNFDTYNVDLIYHIPLIPITLGVRYEQAYQKQTSSSADWTLNVNNLSLLADWRIINSVVYFGPLVSVGYPWSSLKFNDSASSDTHQLNAQQMSYSGGLEAGVYLGPFLVGAESGYKSIHLKGEASSGSSVSSNVDLDGFYGKAYVGITFL
jgi:hypothetical protein